MSSYRVVPVHRGWIAQEEVGFLFFTVWRNMFVNEGRGAGPVVFPYKKAAMDEVVKLHMARMQKAAQTPVTFFVDNYGVAHETADYDR